MALSGWTRVITVTAKSGQSSSHSLQPIQSSGLRTVAFSFSSSTSTSFGQKVTQILHPLHQSLLMITSLNFFLVICLNPSNRSAPYDLRAFPPSPGQHKKKYRDHMLMHGRGIFTKCLRGWIKTQFRDGGRLVHVNNELLLP